MRRLFLPYVVTMIIVAGTLHAPAPGRGADPSAENKIMRDRPTAPERQFTSPTAAQQAKEPDYDTLKVQVEECKALLFSAANDLQTCDAGNATLGQDNHRRVEEVNALRMKIQALEAMLVKPDYAPGQQTPARVEQQDLPVPRDENKRTSEMDALRTKIQALEAMLGEQQKSLTARNKEIDGLKKGPVTDRSDEIAKKSEEISRKTADLAKQSDEVARLKKDLSSAQERVAALTPFEKLVNEKQGIVAAQTAELSNKTAMIARQADEITSKTADIAKKSDEISSKTADLAKQSDEVARLKKDLSSAQENLAFLQQERAGQLKIKTKLAEKVRESTLRIMTLQSQYLTLENELQSLKAKPAP